MQMAIFMLFPHRMVIHYGRHPLRPVLRVISSGVAVEDAAVFATSGGKIFAINAEKEPKTLTTLDATLYAALKYEDEKIILAPASSDGLFMAIDSSGKETWNYLPND